MKKSVPIVLIQHEKDQFLVIRQWVSPGALPIKIENWKIDKIEIDEICERGRYFAFRLPKARAKYRIFVWKVKQIRRKINHEFVKYK